MPSCPSCHCELKPLFTGFFCPSDCDRGTTKSKGGRFSGKILVPWIDSKGMSSKWTCEFVEKDGWPLTRGHAGWHINFNRIKDIRDSDGIFSLYEAVMEYELARRPGPGWTDHPGLMDDFLYTGPQSWPGFVFRKVD